MLLRRVILFVLFLATTLPGFGAVAFVQSKSAIATSSSGTVVPTSNVTANNLELVFCLDYSTGTSCSPTGVLGETFVPITSSNNVSWVVYNGTTQIQAYVRNSHIDRRADHLLFRPARKQCGGDF